MLMELYNQLFPDVVVYGITAIVFIVGIIKCCRPVYRNAAALRRATDLLKEGAKAKLGRPIWGEQNFLGKRMQPVWRSFLNSVDMGGAATDVADYVHDDSVITDPGRASLADVIPGICTSMGILGTFIGLSMGLNGLDVMEINSYVKLTGGIAFAFNTSIAGIIASVLFNVIYRFGTGRARTAIDKFTSAFYAYGIAQPPDAATQILAYEREQADTLNQFAQDMSSRLAGEIQHAITTSMTPVQHAMEDFLNAATRAQVDGLDYIVARFIDRMNKALDGELDKLREALKQTSEGQLGAQENLRHAVESIGTMTQDVVKIQGVSEQLITRFAGYVGDIGSAYREVSEAQADTNDLLVDVSEASERQAKYLSALQEYQSQLQASFQDYTVWTDRFVGSMEERTGAQNASLEQIAGEMRGSAEMLQGSYKSFTEAIERGLANALGLFEENMRGLMGQVDDTLGGIKTTMAELEASMDRVAKSAANGREVK